jgi:alpha-amylase
MSINNGVMFQAFQWHLPSSGTFWSDLAARAIHLSQRGVTAVWLPPAFKGLGGADEVGYGVYDLYDLGEFDQKGTVRTKYGTKDQLVSCVRTLRTAGMQVYADVVLNHRCGADAKERVSVVPIHFHDRTQIVADPFEADIWSRFDFPGRGDTYSAFKWNSTHFTATDHIEGRDDAPGNCVYLLHGKTFSGEVSKEMGNFDFLMGCDVDHYQPDVRDELFRWARWFIDTTNVDGLRLDAVKHYPAGFARDLLNHLRAHFGEREVFAVSEYWSPELGALQSFLQSTDGRTELFDVPLHYKFFAASNAGNTFDMRTIFDDTLVRTNPAFAVTFVDNHDTEPGQGLESWVQPWFKPLAYALILLRKNGYPCVFQGDYDGPASNHFESPSFRELLDKMFAIRLRYNHGDEHDHFDHGNCIAWVRTGDEAHPGSMVVILSNGDVGRKRVQTFAPAGAVFVDALGHQSGEVVAGEDGMAEFTCGAGSVSAWVQA